MSKESKIPDIALNRSYSFTELESYLNEIEFGNRAMLRVYDKRNKEYAIMATFGDNFSDQYHSGDGVLFYSDGDTTSADNDDMFELISVIPIAH
jgi:hypothetical protein